MWGNFDLHKIQVSSATKKLFSRGEMLDPETTLITMAPKSWRFDPESMMIMPMTILIMMTMMMVMTMLTMKMVMTMLIVLWPGLGGVFQPVRAWVRLPAWLRRGKYRKYKMKENTTFVLQI